MNPVIYQCSEHKGNRLEAAAPRPYLLNCQTCRQRKKAMISAVEEMRDARRGQSRHRFAEQRPERLGEVVRRYPPSGIATGTSPPRDSSSSDTAAKALSGSTGPNPTSPASAASGPGRHPSIPPVTTDSRPVPPRGEVPALGGARRRWNRNVTPPAYSGES